MSRTWGEAVRISNALRPWTGSVLRGGAARTSTGSNMVVVGSAVARVLRPRRVRVVNCIVVTVLLIPGVVEVELSLSAVVLLNLKWSLFKYSAG